MDEVKNEFKRIGFHSPEKPSGSRDRPKHDGDDNPESSIEPRGKAGRPSKYMKLDELFWKNEKPKTIVNEFNTITCEHIEINKVVENTSKAYASNCNVMTRSQMMKILTEHNKAMQSQATRGMKIIN